MEILPLPNHLSGAPILYTPVTESTMIDAKALLDRADFVSDYGHGTVVSAGYQTGGRGRYPDRGWVADPDTNLLFTLILEASRVARSGPIPLMLGLSVAEFLAKRLGLDTAVKWPNDVLVGDRKISGILCELRGGYVLAGIGVNVGQRVFPGELSERACSILSETGNEIGIADCLSGILVEASYRLTEPDWRPALSSRLHGIGRMVSTVMKTESTERRFSGTVVGIGLQGGIVIADETGVEREIVSGELSYDRM